MRLDVFGVEGIGEVHDGDDVAGLVAAALDAMGERLRDGDIVVVAQKIVSKAEGRVRALAAVSPGDDARRIAARTGADPRVLQCALDETVRVVRDERVLIVETLQGYVCANAGVDRSNTGADGVVTLLPRDCDASAARIAAGLRERSGATRIGVVVSDSFGRPWRNGVHDVALGVSGIAATIDLRGGRDGDGRLLSGTVVAVADELAGAAELVMGKASRVPAAVVRGLDLHGDGSGRDLIRAAAEDLFR